MNAIKGILWALALSALLWIAMFATIPAIIHEVEWRQERVHKRAKVNAANPADAVKQHLTQKEWTR